MTALTLIGKPDCHLCDVARDVIDQVLAELPDDVADAVEVREASIQDDPALFDQWWEKIPVVLIDDRLHGHWRVAPDRLRAALLDAAATQTA
ncbi:glutaredoxin family protein [Microbacterium marinilacus]|uniref:Glutaredoxin family protein n=1 Tax=Microbacterium marinilacus TaxID=415209 RepID=A0ABP7BDT4_9MICO|nr:glutaredoxin family protein [Microbacterium marinilacus]MBY0686941.1 glutaredoxin family protein [Microbacterium marinilacus]